MTFKDASETVIRFGKYKGKTLDAIGQDKAGRDYLEWVAKQEWLFDDVRAAITAFLAFLALEAQADEEPEY